MTSFSDGPLASLVPAGVEPHQAAIVCERGTLSYAELSLAVARAAVRLRQLGAGPGRTVGVAGERTGWLLVAWLAALVTGARLWPLDGPGDDGPARAGVPLDILVVGGLKAGEATGTPPAPQPSPSAQALVGVADLVAPGPSGADRYDHTGGDAYLVQTSGSSGPPKVTAVARPDLHTVFSGLRTMLGDVIAPGETWSQFHPLSFGYAMWELLGCLRFGGTLRLVPRERPLTCDALAAAVEDRRHGVTVLSVTPSELALLVRRLRAGLAELHGGLRWVVTSGERADAGAFEALLEHCPSVRVLNTYATTETAGQVTAQIVDHRSLDAVRRGEIGRPVPGVEVVLRDEGGRSIPAGDTATTGELCVRGSASASRYLDPERTRGRFAGSTGSREREFRTRDLARWTPGGGLVLVGRAERTSKIGGRWVSLDTLEVDAAALPGVDAVVLLPSSDTAAGVRYEYVLAGVVLRFPTPSSLVAVRARLNGALGGTSTIRLLPLDTLPTTPRGKVDHEGLRRLAEVAAEPKRSSPGDVDSAVRAAWTRVLGAGVADDAPLLESGADSLAIAAVAAELSRLTGVEVTPERVLAAPTVSAQAAALRARLAGDAPAGASPATVRRSALVAARRGTGRAARLGARTSPHREATEVHDA